MRPGPATSTPACVFRSLFPHPRCPHATSRGQGSCGRALPVPLPRGRWGPQAPPLHRPSRAPAAGMAEARLCRLCALVGGAASSRPRSAAESPGPEPVLGCGRCLCCPGGGRQSPAGGWGASSTHARELLQNQQCGIWGPGAQEGRMPPPKGLGPHSAAQGSSQCPWAGSSYSTTWLCLRVPPSPHPHPGDGASAEAGRTGTSATWGQAGCLDTHDTHLALKTGTGAGRPPPPPLVFKKNSSPLLRLGNRRGSPWASRGSVPRDGGCWGGAGPAAQRGPHRAPHGTAAGPLSHTPSGTSPGAIALSRCILSTDAPGLLRSEPTAKAQQGPEEGPARGACAQCCCFCRSSSLVLRRRNQRRQRPPG